MQFVLDNSVTMRWLLASTKTDDQNYAVEVLKSLSEQQALVPNLWHLEVTNVLLGAEKRQELTSGQSEDFLIQLESLPLRVDDSTPLHAFNRTLGLARSYNLSSYDASYLELAIRTGVPLATLDKALIRAAKKADVNLYLL
ncbi:MAG: putative nucleic acid-binding protein [Phenylobacterium sp.]|jgi:predicted nucleic acid-binding protein